MRASKPNLDTSKFDLSQMRIAIVSAKWNQSFNQEMADEARVALIAAGMDAGSIDSYEVPGAFEMPIFCKRLSDQIATKYDAILCFGTVIRGETIHFELVANESARGIMAVSIETGVPILNGILACENEAQADARASAAKENKGKEVALSAIALLSELAKLN